MKYKLKSDLNIEDFVFFKGEEVSEYTDHTYGVINPYLEVAIDVRDRPDSKMEFLGVSKFYLTKIIE
jgi:hypothetical protein